MILLQISDINFTQPTYPPLGGVSMGITYVRLSTSSNVREKLDLMTQESGKSIDEIVNLALEKYLKSGYNLPISNTFNSNTTTENYGNNDTEDLQT